MVVSRSHDSSHREFAAITLDYTLTTTRKRDLGVNRNRTAAARQGEDETRRARKEGADLRGHILGIRHAPGGHLGGAWEARYTNRL